MIVSAGKTYQLPSEGSVQGVLAEVVDLGEVESTWNGQKKVQHKCLLTFEIDEATTEGVRMIVSRRFTASLSDRAALRAFLEGWRGKSFTAEELAAFDLESLVGANAILSLSHNTTDNKTYCNIASATRLLKGMEKIAVSSDYVTFAERMARRNAVAAGASTEPPTGNAGGYVPDDDDLPF